MATEITVRVGNSFAQRHEVLQSQIEDYDEIMRRTIEDSIHEMTQTIERQADAVEAQQGEFEFPEDED